MSADAIDRLRRVAASLERGEMPDPGDAGWFAQAVARYLREAPAGVTLDRAFDVATQPGQRTWWRREAEAERDRALRRFRSEHFGSLDIASAACEIVVGVRRARTLRTNPADALLRQLADIDGKARVPGPDRVRRILRRAG